jgi:hypothetical protein
VTTLREIVYNHRALKQAGAKEVEDLLVQLHALTGARVAAATAPALDDARRQLAYAQFQDSLKKPGSLQTELIWRRANPGLAALIQEADGA